MKTLTVINLLLLLSVTSCFKKNPLGSATQVIPTDFHPGLSQPTITSISPNEGPNVGGTNVSIYGSGFKSGVTVTLDGTACSSVTFVSSSRIVCMTPAHLIGTVDVIVTNTDSTTVTFDDGFTYTTNVSGVPGFGVVMGGVVKMTGTTTTLQGTIGEPVTEPVMSSTSVQLRPGIQGVMYDP